VTDWPFAGPAMDASGAGVGGVAGAIYDITKK